MQDMLSNYKKYLLKSTDIQKSKSYSVLVYDAKMATKVFIGLEEVGLSNVSIAQTAHSESKKLQLLMNGKAIENAKSNAASLTKPLNQKVGNAILISNGFNFGSDNQIGIDQIVIRGNSSIYGSRATDYNSNIEFAKIKISSNVSVSFSLE